MAAGDIQGRGLICKHPSKGLKKAVAHFVIFKAEGGISAAQKIDAIVPSFIFFSSLLGCSDDLANSQSSSTFNFHEVASLRNQHGSRGHAGSRWDVSLAVNIVLWKHPRYPARGPALRPGLGYGLHCQTQSC